MFQQIWLITFLLTYHSSQAVELSRFSANSTANLTIINGHQAEPHEAPYMAAIVFHTPTALSFCGGVLISPQHILTAGHCLLGAKKATIKLGAHMPHIREPSQMVFKEVTDMKSHNNFNCQIHANDIAIIKLPRKVSQTEHIKYAKLPKKSDVKRISYVGKVGRVYGWGATSSNALFSNVLNYVDLNIVENDECKRGYPDVTDKNLCTSPSSTGTVFRGDSGGPLVVDGTVIGLVSYGDNRCSTSSPNVFVSISRYLDWIKKNSK